jgi:hypothetical protein
VCRQAAFRLRSRRDASGFLASDVPGRFAYADPPYPGFARKYYGREPTYAGEVDHAQLIARLESGGFDGWALSTDADALQRVLALCPQGVRVCPWVKPMPPDPRTYGPTKRWEPLIVRGGRLRQGASVRDFLYAGPARESGEPELIGRKPLAFCVFLFDQLGMLPGDALEDWFPGTGIVSRSWDEICRSVAVSMGDTSSAPAANGCGVNNQGTPRVRYL